MYEYDPSTQLWTTKSVIPRGVYGGSGIAYQNKLYCMGGTQDAYNHDTHAFDPWEWRSFIQIYDPTIDTWTSSSVQLPFYNEVMGLGVTQAGLIMYGGEVSSAWPQEGGGGQFANVFIFSNTQITSEIQKGYCFGGSQSGVITNNIKEYSYTAGTWADSDPTGTPPSAKTLAGSTVLHGNVYVIGGLNSGGTAALAEHNMYNPVANAWTTRSTTGFTARYDSFVGNVNNKLYVIGGCGTGGEGNILTSMEEYDPATDTWTSKTVAPVALYNGAAGSIGDYLICFGGKTNVGRVDTVMAYNTHTNEWQYPLPKNLFFDSTELNTPWSGMSITKVDGELYMTYGTCDTTGSPGVPRNTIYKITIDTEKMGKITRINLNRSNMQPILDGGHL